MKTLFKLTLLLLIFSVALTSCNDDGEDLGKRIVRYGVIVGDNSKYNIKCDDGTILNVSVNLVPQIEVKNGDRLIVNYTPLGPVPEGDRNEQYVRVNMLYSVLSKGPVAESFILADSPKRNDSIGNDPIRLLDAWFGGEYLNINFETERRPYSEVAHFINLVHDDTYTASDSVMVTLRHNGYDDIPAAGKETFSAFGRVSFKISSLIPEGKESIKLGLHWTEFGKTINDRVRKFDSGTFTPYGTDAVKAATPSAGTLNKRVGESRFGLDKFATTVE